MKRKRSVVSISDILECSQQTNNGMNNSQPHNMISPPSTTNNSQSQNSYPQFSGIGIGTQSLKDIITSSSSRMTSRQQPLQQQQQQQAIEPIMTSPSSQPRPSSQNSLNRSMISAVNNNNNNNKGGVDMFQWQLLLSKMELVENRIGF